MTAAKTRGIGEAIAAAVAASSAALSRLGLPLVRRLAQRLRKPLLIVVGGVILLMLLIVVLQSGLGVDSDDTITDSHRPEIVGD